MSCRTPKSSQRRHFDLKLPIVFEIQGDLVSALCTSRSMSFFLFVWNVGAANNGPLFCCKGVRECTLNDWIDATCLYRTFRTYNYFSLPIN